MPTCRYHSQSISAVCSLNSPQSYVNAHRQTDRHIYKCMCFLCVHLKRFCAILLGQLSSTVFSLFILPLDQCVSHWFWMSNSSLQRISYFIISSCFIVVVCWLPTSHCYVVSCEIVAAAATLIQILVKVI